MTNERETGSTVEKSLLQIEDETLEKKDLSSLSAEEQYDLIMQKSSDELESYMGEELLDKLRDSKATGRPLHIKFGIDPTGADIHIGHGVPLIMLGRLQKMGHHIDLLIGDFTARVGDPSGTNKEREVIPIDQIKKNMEKYIEQMSRVIDFSNENVSIKFNSEWLDNISISEWLEITRKISANKLVQRDYFRKRVRNGESVSLLELSYPVLMAYDSVVMQPDIEIGGADQLVNLLWCRELMTIFKEKPESFITVDILSGLKSELDDNGKLKKMSKSANNYIKIEEDPSDMYAKVMSLPDELMWGWFKNLTDITKENLSCLIGGLESGRFSARDIKRLLARLVVSTFTTGNLDVAQTAQEIFDQKFGKNKALIPKDIIVYKALIGSDLIDVLSELTKESRTSLRKMIAGIYFLDGDQYKRFTVEKLLSTKINEHPMYIKLGKRRYFKINGIETISANNIQEELQTLDKIKSIVSTEPIIVKEPSLAMITESLNTDNQKSIYYGTGIATPEFLSVGLPFDVLGMILINEKIRREAGFSKVYHHIADTHAKTNSWAIPKDVNKRATEIKKTLEIVFSNLGLNNFEVVLSSSFDNSSSYLDILKFFNSSKKHDYVKREMADMDWYYKEKGVLLKTGWIIQSKETKIGSDERLFDREYRNFMGKDALSFVYTEAGRTFDVARPKASPYIQIPGETRLLLDKNENVRAKFQIVKDKIGMDNVKSTIKHLYKIVSLYEDIFGSLGELDIEAKLEVILNRCFRNE